MGNIAHKHGAHTQKYNPRLHCTVVKTWSLQPALSIVAAYVESTVEVDFGKDMRIAESLHVFCCVVLRI
jgi:hypothetical protein